MSNDISLYFGVQLFIAFLSSYIVMIAFFWIKRFMFDP